MSVVIHSAQKLLNTSKIEAIACISKPYEGQFLQSWYARLVSSGFPGKLLVIYVHEPSLLTVVCKGKTIRGTWEEFCTRLPRLLTKAGFPQSQVHFEINLMKTYIVAKTISRSMNGYMSQIAQILESPKSPSYESISQEDMEDFMLRYLYSTRIKNVPYTTPAEYWKNFLLQL